MTEPKTRPTDADVDEFLANVANERRRADAMVVDQWMREATGEKPVLWGPSIVGYGSKEYVDARGRASSWPVIAFSPRKAELVLYLDTGMDPAVYDVLGPHRRGVACLYLKRLDAVDQQVLRRLITHSVETTLH